ncbi:MAG: hypothetical protein ACR2PM_15630 [Hyphomicrobiales bacterium]
MRRLLSFLWKSAIGIVFCLTPVTAILVVGWTARAMQRTVLRAWFRRSSRAVENGPFPKFARASPSTRRLAHWPNWFIAEDMGARIKEARAGGAGFTGRLGVLIRASLGAFWTNFTTGISVILSTWLLTLPACVLWLLAWWGGWENSFNKGYEQAWVGPVVGLTGTALFVVAMTYVPLAQARQAAAGSWRAFFDFRLVRMVGSGNALSLLMLAILFVIAGFIIALFRVGPLAIGNFSDYITKASAVQDYIADAPPEELKRLAAAYWLAGAAFTFYAFVLLRHAAARLYARALLASLRTGRIKAKRLSKTEYEFLYDLRLLEPPEETRSGVVMRAVKSSSKGLFRLIAMVLGFALWFAFVALIFISQFLNHDWFAWINQPLVQLPWLHWLL